MTQRISYQDIDAAAMRGLYQTERYIAGSGLDAKLLELIRFRVSQINHCAFCLDMHAKEALELGETPVRLYSVSAWRECPFYLDHEKAALEFAEALTDISRLDISDELYERLRLYYSVTEVTGLSLAIANINTWNRLNRTMRTVPGNYQVGQFSQV